MSVSYKCPSPNCGVALKTPMRAPGGKSVACPKCGVRFVAEPHGGGDTPMHPGTSRAVGDPPATREQGSADRARLAHPAPIQATEPLRLNTP